MLVYLIKLLYLCSMHGCFGPYMIKGSGIITRAARANLQWSHVNLLHYEINVKDPNII